MSIEMAYERTAFAPPQASTAAAPIRGGGAAADIDRLSQYHHAGDSTSGARRA